MRVFDVFSGIGGFSLGLERAGLRTVAFCEIDEKCRRVLRRHWPHVPIHEDIRTVDADEIAADVLAGGFPCQPFSTAARGRNNKADLWPHMRGLAERLRVRWLLAENVPGLGYNGVDRVCADLEGSGYAVWPFRLDTAPPGRHRGRDRFIIVAHADVEGKPRRPFDAEVASVQEVSGRRWANDAAPVGVDDGLPGRMDRLQQIGNSISPWVAEMFGHAIMSVSNQHNT